MIDERKNYDSLNKTPGQRELKISKDSQYWPLALALNRDRAERCFVILFKELRQAINGAATMEFDEPPKTRES